MLAVFGAKRQGENERYISWGTSPSGSSLLLIKPLDGKPATAGNGAMVSLSVDSKALVDAVYKKALELGAKDEGPAGAREPGFLRRVLPRPRGQQARGVPLELRPGSPEAGDRRRAR